MEILHSEANISRHIIMIAYSFSIASLLSLYMASLMMSVRTVAKHWATNVKSISFFLTSIFRSVRYSANFSQEMFAFSLLFFWSAFLGTFNWSTLKAYRCCGDICDIFHSYNSISHFNNIFLVGRFLFVSSRSLSFTHTHRNTHKHFLLWQTLIFLHIALRHLCKNSILLEVANIIYKPHTCFFVGQ